MFRSSKGKPVIVTKAITALFVLLLVLNCHASKVVFGQDTEISQYEAQTSDGILAQTSQPSSSQLNVSATTRFNVTLWIKDWEKKVAYENLNVTVFDLNGKMASSTYSNRTGYVNLKFLSAGSYIISIQSGNRTVGFEKIDIKKSETFVIRTWSYDLNLTLVDVASKRLSNHTIFLYDQMVFKAPNHTIGVDQVKRIENYTIMTDQVGLLVNRTETNRNGTGNFVRVWNGTYRIKVLRNESWTKEYVLGELVNVHHPSISGEYILTVQEPTSLMLKCFRADLSLKFVTESNTPVQNATVRTRNGLGHLLFKDLTNRTGFIEHKNIYVIDRLYSVQARYGNRTIGYRVINATETGTFQVKVWAYNLTVKVVDQENKPLRDHIVFLYDQVVFYTPTNFTAVANRTGLMVNYTKTDEKGMACFKDVWNGTYKIIVAGGQPIAEEIINLRTRESVTLRGNKTYLAFKFITENNEPLSNVTVHVYNSGGHLVFRDYTNQEGYIRYDGIYLDNYTIFSEWMGTEVWSGNVDVSKNRELTMVSPIFRLTLRFVDPSGNPLPYADVTLRRKLAPWRYVGSALSLETDENGIVSRLLSSGVYEVSCYSGIYSASLSLNLIGNYGETITCSVVPNAWLATVALASPLIGLALLLERKRLGKPLEVRRYKNMLSKLESMYKSGLVEYRLYRRLREEYEARLMELSGREMR